MRADYVSNIVSVSQSPNQAQLRKLSNVQQAKIVGQYLKYWSENIKKVDTNVAAASTFFTAVLK